VHVAPPVKRPAPMRAEPPQPSPAQMPWRPQPLPRTRRIGCFHLGVISGLGGFATLFFVGAYYAARNPMDLVVSWIFGTALSVAVGLIATSVSPQD
jgi:hypothetical protein